MAGDIHVSLNNISNKTKDFRDNVYNPITKSAKVVKAYSGGGKNSITALSKDLIMQFPVLMSAGVPTDDAMTIALALQKKYAALHLAIWSADTAFGTDASQNGIRDFVRRYHNNNDIPDLITYGGNLLTNISDISGALATDAATAIDDPNCTWAVESAQFLDDAVFVDPTELAGLWDIPDMKFATESINDFYTPDLTAIDTINDISAALEASWDKYSSDKATKRINDAYNHTQAKMQKQTERANAKEKKLIEKQEKAEKMERLKNINRAAKDDYRANLSAAKTNPLKQDKRYDKYSGESRHTQNIKDMDDAISKASKTRSDKYTKELQKTTDKYGAAAAQQMASAGKIKYSNESKREKDLREKRDAYTKMDAKNSKGEYLYGKYEYTYDKGRKGVNITADPYATAKDREKAYNAERKIEQRNKDLRRYDALMGKAANMPGTVSPVFGMKTERGANDVAKFINADKINSITPTLLDVSFLMTGRPNGAMVANTSNIKKDYLAHAVVGVKCMTRLISPSLMIPNIISSCQDSSLAFKWVKWTKGEMKVAKDMIFNISRIKEDAHAQNMADKWFAALRKRKRNASAFKFGGNTGINPFTTLVITDEDALRIKEASGYDLYNLGTARKLMDNLYLLGFMIVNTTTGMTSTLYDGYADFEDATIKSLRLSNKDNKSDLETINDIFRRMGRV